MATFLSHGIVYSVLVWVFAEVYFRVDHLDGVRVVASIVYIVIEFQVISEALPLPVSNFEFLTLK
jgi:hypothetical protein